VIAQAAYFLEPGTVPIGLALGALLAIAGIGLLIGVATPFSAAAVGLITGAMALNWLPFHPRGLVDGKLPAALTACVAFALIFIGPGAYSLDAKFFGRREIIIPPGPQAPQR